MRLAVLAGLAWASLSLGGWAQAAGDGSGFVVSPAFGQLEVKADQPGVAYSLQLTNHNMTDQSFRLSAVDFGSLDEEGGVAFLGQPASELEHKYGLASWMTLEKDEVSVPAGGSVKVAVNIDNRASLAPGGHYGAVLATAVMDTSKLSGDSVGVKQVLSSLVLLTKDGGVQDDLRLVSQSSDGSFWRLPQTVAQRYENAGNVHVTPRGVVAVQDPRGHVVERAAINEASGVILPGSFRRFRTDLLKVGQALLPGRYTVVSTYRYEGTETVKTLKTSFWYVGALVVWLVGVLALAAVGGLAWWLWWRPRRRR